VYFFFSLSLLSLLLLSFFFQVTTVGVADGDDGLQTALCGRSVAAGRLSREKEKKREKGMDEVVADT